jgi:hypothetical protein
MLRNALAPPRTSICGSSARQRASSQACKRPEDLMDFMTFENRSRRRAPADTKRGYAILLQVGLLLTGSSQGRTNSLGRHWRSWPSPSEPFSIRCWPVTTAFGTRWNGNGHEKTIAFDAIMGGVLGLLRPSEVASRSGPDERSERDHLVVVFEHIAHQTQDDGARNIPEWPDYSHN